MVTCDVAWTVTLRSCLKCALPELFSHHGRDMGSERGGALACDILVTPFPVVALSVVSQYQLKSAGTFFLSAVWGFPGPCLLCVEVILVFSLRSGGRCCRREPVEVSAVSKGEMQKLQ